MAEYVDLDAVITAQLYDDEHEDWVSEEMTVRDYLYLDCDHIPLADVRPVVKKEEVMAALRNYFTIGDSYTYELTRSKEAFGIGTMSLDDFREWGEDNISDLCEYLMQKLFLSKIVE